MGESLVYKFVLVNAYIKGLPLSNTCGYTVVVLQLGELCYFCNGDTIQVCLAQRLFTRKVLGALDFF